MSELEKMLLGEMYDPSNETLSEMRKEARTLTYKYNQTTREQSEEREGILTKLIGSISGGISIEPLERNRGEEFARPVT